MTTSISVIIPVYNVEAYLASCLDSVLCQTLENIEIICVNDCSSDDSQKILDSYSSRDNRIITLMHEKNSGQPAARNLGLKQCNGEYVFFLDSDDLLFSQDSLATLYSIAKQDNADEVIGATLRWNEITEERLFGYHINYLKKPLSKAIFAENQYLRSNVIGCNKLLKKSFLDKNLLNFNTNLRKFEDSIFSWKTHLYAQSISLTLQATYIHRQRSESGPQSIMQNQTNDFNSHTLAIQDMLTFLSTNLEFIDLRHNFDRFFFYWLQLDACRINKIHPSKKERKDVINAYAPLLNDIPETSLACLPEHYKNILSSITKGDIDETWQTLTGKTESRTRITNMDNEINVLKAELDAVYHSTSWRVTAFLRKIRQYIKKTS